MQLLSVKSVEAFFVLWVRRMTAPFIDRNQQQEERSARSIRFLRRPRSDFAHIGDEASRQAPADRWDSRPPSLHYHLRAKIRSISEYQLRRRRPPSTRNKPPVFARILTQTRIVSVTWDCANIATNAAALRMDSAVCR